ncbi:MAG: hypothetical protein DRR00_23575 [Candidatus Parabeggiatoa sp. nov. 3]|nr:MAG: hypothetical protein DRR00_23575 [Gammaproteobacteria bacterium]RKZ61499.1 MAG: hypothetical protein DRQ99_20315 [Gammaproteobacteria bacterium]
MLDIKIIEKLKKASAKRSPDFLDSLIFHDFTLKYSEAKLQREIKLRATFHAKVLRAKLYLASRTEGSRKSCRQLLREM